MVKICISTCKQYQDKTIPILVPQLLENGIRSEDIHVVSGGYLRREPIINKWNISYYEANHNSFDITALIDVVTCNIEADNWLLLHDTCTVGSKFKEKLYNFNSDSKCTALTWFPSMSIGNYKYSYLQEQKDLIISGRNIDYTQEGLRKAKIWALDHEDFLMWKSSISSVVNCYAKPGEQFRVNIQSDIDQYKTGTPRITEYFPQLDLYKIKANWDQRPHEDPVITL